MFKYIFSKPVPSIFKNNLKKYFFNRVLGGPFKGLLYIKESFCSSYLPKIFGTYELEIVDYIVLGCKGVDYVIDIGAAEGYYAVGLLFNNPKLMCIAFECDKTAKDLLDRLAILNNVADRLICFDKADCVSLQTVLSQNGRGFVVVDIEGGEFELIDPVNVPGLKEIEFIVEIHDWFYPELNADSIFRDRFSSTHNIKVINARTPLYSDISHFFWRSVAFLNRDIASKMLEERPPIMRWFLFTLKI